MTDSKYLNSNLDADVIPSSGISGGKDTMGQSSKTLVMAEDPHKEDLFVEGPAFVVRAIHLDLTSEQERSVLRDSRLRREYAEAVNAQLAARKLGPLFGPIGFEYAERLRPSRRRRRRSRFLRLMSIFG